jgi:AcrR family transcriptional regulator
LRAALELVERDGLGEFSMRKLGAALGVEATSLYHHFPSKAHLFDALLDRLLAESTVEGPERPWRERARRLCIAYRELSLRYPEFSRYMILHRMNTRGALAWLESVVRIFTDAGFEAELAARAFRGMGYYLMGAVLDETAGYARGPTAAEPMTPDEQARLAPKVVAFGAYFQREHWDRTFLAGLELLLDGFERKLAAASATTASEG